MNASEAAKKAQKVREEKAIAAKKSQDARARKEAAEWRKKRADFLVEFYKEVENSIEEAVKAGKKRVDIKYLAKTGSARTTTDAERYYEASPLRDLVEKVFARFRAKGFSIMMTTFCHEHYVNYETSNDMYYSYTRGCIISWDK